ncbi:hypothetical protein [Dictyobacter halimunensis]|uniref:hypothetical protein n=1 Tax=Dictyobacter halimunensis TaxID=3026934 RepID=UPI0030C6738D
MSWKLSRPVRGRGTRNGLLRSNALVPYPTLGQTGDAVVVAAGVLPGVDHAALDVAARDIAEGIIVVAGHQGARAVGHAHNRACPLNR